MYWGCLIKWNPESFLSFSMWKWREEGGWETLGLLQEDEQETPTFVQLLSLIVPAGHLILQMLDVGSIASLLAVCRRLRFSYLADLAQLRLQVPSDKESINQLLLLLLSATTGACRLSTVLCFDDLAVFRLFADAVAKSPRSSVSHLEFNLWNWNNRARDLQNDRHLRLVAPRFPLLRSLVLKGFNPYQLKQLNHGKTLSSLSQLNILNVSGDDVSVTSYAPLYNTRMPFLTSLSLVNWSFALDVASLCGGGSFQPRLQQLDIGLFLPPSTISADTQQFLLPKTLRHLRLAIFEYTPNSANMASYLGHLDNLETLFFKVFGSKEIKGLLTLSLTMPFLPRLTHLKINYHGDYHPHYNLEDFSSVYSGGLRKLELEGQFSTDFTPLSRFKRLRHLSLMQTPKEVEAFIPVECIQHIPSVSLEGKFVVVK